MKKTHNFFFLLGFLTVFFSCSPQSTIYEDSINNSNDADVFDTDDTSDLIADSDTSDINDATDATDATDVTDDDVVEYTPILKTTFVNVGQGDASLIENQTNDYILIDSGRKIADAIHLRNLLPSNGVFTLFIATHFDADHMGSSDRLVCGNDMEPGVANVDDDNNGNIDVRIEPGEYGASGSDDILPCEVWDRGDYELSSTTEVDEYQAAFEGLRNIPSPGDIFNVDSNGSTLTVLSVNGNLENGDFLEPTDENARSISVLISIGNFDMFIGGDLPIYIEEAIAQKLANKGITLDVLHLGHHGSDTSTSELTLALLQPKVAIISVGNSVSCGTGFNTYGHPKQEVLDKLEANGIQYVFQTNEGGAKPATGTCNPATDETYPRDYHNIDAYFANSDIILTTDGTDFVISFGTESFVFSALTN